jgi:hypothetical protein
MPKSSHLIPENTVATLRLKLLPGGYNDPSQGWLEGVATKASSGSIYLRFQCEVQSGEHRAKTFYTIIGLHSPKGNFWRKMGRQRILDLLNSQAGIANDDYSDQAMRYRRLRSLNDLNGLKFNAVITIKKDQNGKLINDIGKIISTENEGTSSQRRRLRQTDLTAKLTQAETKPMWLTD